MKPLILAAFAVPALVAGVSDMHSHHHDIHLHIHDMIVQRLDLTQDQQTAIHKIGEAHHPALRADGAALIEARSGLISMLADPKATEEQIREMEAKGSEADLALELELHQMAKEIDPLLTEAQRAKVRQLMAEFHGHVEDFLTGAHGGAPESSRGKN
jgi:Spy/CpxP family protein refolding chaperone